MPAAGRVVPGEGQFRGQAGCFQGAVSGVCAGQAGVLARVVTAGAVQLAVRTGQRSRRWRTVALRARCQIRSMTVRYFASSWPALCSWFSRRGSRRSRPAGAVVGDLPGLDRHPGARTFFLRGPGGAAAQATPRVISVSAASRRAPTDQARAPAEHRAAGRIGADQLAASRGDSRSDPSAPPLIQRRQRRRRGTRGRCRQVGAQAEHHRHLLAFTVTQCS